MTYSRTNHEIELASGAFLELTRPDPAVITLDDVAHGLAHTCRFAGQSSVFYSVAEHACVVADKLRSLGHGRRIIFAGLHHDDAEAFIGDVSAPLKDLIPDYHAIERRTTTAIGMALHLPMLNYAESHAVKAADHWALAAEAHHLMRSQGANWWCADLYTPDAPPSLTPTGVGPKQAKAEWLARHAYYLPRMTREISGYLSEAPDVGPACEGCARDLPGGFCACLARIGH